APSKPDPSLASIRSIKSIRSIRPHKTSGAGLQPADRALRRLAPSRPRMGALSLAPGVAQRSPGTATHHPPQSPGAGERAARASTGAALRARRIGFRQPHKVIPALRASAAAGSEAAADGEDAQRQCEDDGVEEGVDCEAGGERREWDSGALAREPVGAGEQTPARLKRWRVIPDRGVGRISYDHHRECWPPSFDTPLEPSLDPVRSALPIEAG